MTRRSSLTALQSQQRAASRMTVGTQAWLEQPVPQPWKGKAAVVDPGMFIWDTPVIRRQDYDIDVPSTTIAPTLPYFAGERTILIVASSTGDMVTVMPGWEVLSMDVVGGNTTHVLFHESLVDESIPIVSFGPETHPFNRVHVSGMSFLGDYDYVFTPSPVMGHVGHPGTLHSWAGDPRARRMRVITVRGVWTDWSNPPGHPAIEVGWLAAANSWWHDGMGDWGNPEQYLKGEFLASPWDCAGLGVAGPVCLSEYHIEVS